MENQISALLISTYSSSNDADIKNAESILFQSISQPNFFPSLLNIILNPSNQIQLRASGILFLDRTINLLWNQQNSPFTTEAKKCIFQFIPQLLKTSPPQMIRNSSHLTVDLIKQTYITNEWPEIYSEIVNGFSNVNEDNHILCSLILSNSLISTFLLINKNSQASTLQNLNNANQLLIQFTMQNLIQSILGVFQLKKNNVQLIASCYQLVNHLLKFDDSLLNQIFSLNNFLIGLIQEMIQLSLHIREVPATDPSFEPFLKKVMKFLTICYSKQILSSLISIEFINKILPIIQEMLKSNLTNPIKCITLRFLSKIFSNAALWKETGEANVAKILVDIISPLFAISQIDFEMAYNDPANFISENQKIVDDFNDLKASSSSILYKSAKEHDIILSLCVSNVSNAVQMFGNNQINHLNLFSIFHMCSSVINIAASKSNDTIISLFHSMYPLFQMSSNNTNQFASAAAFFLLASCTSLKYSKELIQVVFANIDNSFNLTSYLAIECISSILRQISGDPSLSPLKEQLFKEYGAKLEQSFQTLLNISHEVSNENLIVSFIHFFSLFGERLLPFSQKLAINFLDIIKDVTSSGNSVNSNNEALDIFSTLIMVINSFTSLLKIIAKSDQISSQLYPIIYHNLIQLFPNIPDSVVDTYITLFNQIILDSPSFSPSYWEVTSIINPKYSKSFNKLLELIQFKEIDIQNDGQAIQFMLNYLNIAITQINDFHEFQYYCPSFTGFILRLKQAVLNLNNGGVFTSIVQKTIALIQFLYNEEMTGEDDDLNSNDAIQLLNALIFVGAPHFVNICGQSLPFIFNYWQQNLSFPLSIPATASLISVQGPNDDQKSVWLASCVNLAYNNLAQKSMLMMMNAAEGDDDDDYDDIDGLEEEAENCPWFSGQEVAAILVQIIGAHQQNPSLLAKCDPKQVAFLAEYAKGGQ